MEGLSINIPIFNTDVTLLVRDLASMAGELQMPCEINLADDGSTNGCGARNAQLKDEPRVRYFAMEKNAGRSKTRNYLAQKSTYAYLLFLDSDVAIPDRDFLKRYEPLCKGQRVAYGGYRYRPELYRPECSLRWVYEHSALAAAKERQKTPYTMVTTMNLLIAKSLMLRYPFHEELTKYGHEDTILAHRLEEAGIEINHIDNHVWHEHVDTNEVFLQKTYESLRNVVKIDQLSHSRGEPCAILILNVYRRLEKLHMVWAVRLFHKIFAPLLLSNLRGSHPRVLLYQIYKLGYFCDLQEKEEERKEKEKGQTG